MAIVSILIANRGEIACRVIRTAKALGLKTVAVYSDAEANAPHVKQADQAVRIGPAPVNESYLKAGAILDAAKAAGADAIHPGYGFLSENAEFAEAVAAAGLTFIGPPAEAIRIMGDKAGAKRAMIAAGVPCVPGYQGEDQSDERLIAEAGEIGFPVMVKASAGGGGRGMRLVHDAADLPVALRLARAEALSAFGADHLIIEKAVMRPRHVEVQVFADAHGTTVHLGERDCSVQRRHQKVVEEAPCPVMTPELREAMGAAAVAAAEAVDYRGAGTVEFLLDADGSFYFLEMNTRLQVEHPVTEEITGLDLVALQIAVAEGKPLGLSQADVALNGHAIEVRLYAEDPANDFLPSTGDIALWRPASGAGVRIDAGIEEGGEVSPFYDPMLSKIIAHGPTREDARRRLIRALEATALVGPANNRGFLIDVLSREAFIAGEATTAFIGETWPEGVAASAPSEDMIAVAAALILQAERDAAYAAAGRVSCELLGWRSDGAAETRLTIGLGEGEERALRAVATHDGWRIEGREARMVDLSAAHTGVVEVDGVRLMAQWSMDADGALALSLPEGEGVFRRVRAGGEAAAGGATGFIAAPMPGLLVEIAVAVGDAVEAGATVAVIEAMKMRHRILADVSGAVAEIGAEVGAQMASGDLVLRIDAA
ncbi:MAG: acetyl-CoA carboxylase biotin carboxylase subunit [Pseudomonadota bacterium]